jgi:hypothetical protein
MESIVALDFTMPHSGVQNFGSLFEMANTVFQKQKCLKILKLHLNYYANKQLNEDLPSLV